MEESSYLSHVKLLQEKLQVEITNSSLYYIATCHRSFQNEAKKSIGNNERLEFLGDSILSLVVSDFLYREFPDFTEGELSFAKSKLVDAQACAAYARQLQIDSLLLLGKGETQNLGKGRDSVIADFFEAVLGAMYLDKDIEAVKKFLMERFFSTWKDSTLRKEENEKVLLQEYSQKKFQQTPEYRTLSEEGPDHDKKFIVSVSINGNQLAEGMGSSKKQAQLNAAKAALEALKISGEET